MTNTRLKNHTASPTPANRGRRRFLHSAVFGVTGLALNGALPGLRSVRAETGTPTADLNWIDLGAGFGLVQGAGANVLVHRGADGVLMIDGGREEHAGQLLEFVAAHCDGESPSLLFNSHWHWDQIGSNAKLKQQGVDIIAHENTRLWLTTDVIRRWQDDRVFPRRPQSMWPTKTFYWDERSLDFNGQPIKYGLLQQAHTDGDIYIQFVESNVIFVGDVVSGSGYPLVDYSTNGWIGGMVEGLEKLLNNIDDQTKVVASSGSVLSKADVQAQYEMCDTVIRRIVENYYAGSTYEEFLASTPTAEFDAVWGDPGLFLQTAYESVWGHVARVRNYLRR